MEKPNFQLRCHAAYPSEKRSKMKIPAIQDVNHLLGLVVNELDGNVFVALNKIRKAEDKLNSSILILGATIEESERMVQDS